MASSKYLVLDAAPLLTSTPASLRGLADHYVTTSDVISEIRDKSSRDLLNDLEWLNLNNRDGESTGVKVINPSAEAVAKVSAFARLTGDLAVLSQADIRVLALTYMLEVQENGTWRLREAPGKLSQEEEEKKARKEKVKQRKAAEQAANKEDPQKSTDSVSEITENLDNASIQPAQPEAAKSSPTDPVCAEISAESATQDNNDSDSDGGEWITPANVHLHKSKDLGLFPSLPTLSSKPLTADAAPKTKAKSAMKAACLTGDYAMQNVAIQMGLNVLGVGGKRVKEVRTWVLRCHACYQLCKDPLKKFCPACGNATLIRTSITYVTPTTENPKGYVLHLKANYQYRNRGTQFSIPNPKQGSSNVLKHGKNEIILREDQKEFMRGMRKAEISRHKAEKAAAKSMAEGGKAMDPDLQADLLLGDSSRGRYVYEGFEMGKDGLPVVGFGRRNPNEKRRGGRR